MADGITSFKALSKSLMVIISLSNTSGASFSSSKLSSGSNLLKHFMVCLFAQVFKICTYETMGHCRHPFLINICVQWHVARMNLEYL